MSDVDAEEADSELGKHSTRANHGALLSSQIKTVQRAGGVADGLALPSVLKACACEEGPGLHVCASPCVRVQGWV
ncbi:hypothetical protein ZWY2020_020599 [Hordeum vulgare]|nr:hypothetical protein ZWY2020_020599 [Hordeum vulgare]